MISFLLSIDLVLKRLNKIPIKHHFSKFKNIIKMRVCIEHVQIGFLLFIDNIKYNIRQMCEGSKIYGLLCHLLIIQKI